MNQPRTLKTVTLGCKVNQYETEFVRQGFERLGYRKASEAEPVDLCIVNTCTVTAESEAKCRKIIRRLAKAHPQAEIIVLGCFAARAPADAAALPGVVEVLADKRDLPNLLARRGLQDVPAGIGRFDGRRRALVKVQDGCRMKCSYCIVPTVRPHLISRPVDEVLDEVRRLLAAGHREIVLTGVHLGDYGGGERKGARGEGTEASENDGASSSKSEIQPVNSHHCPLPTAHCRRFPLPSPLSSLPALLRQITDLNGDFRVRLSSIEAAEVTPELIGLMAERRDRVCPHLHLPLQSGSNAVLRRMNRRGTVEEFVARCRAIRAALDRPALTTDVIVGFPGETEADFAATFAAVAEVGFAKVHVFRFSPRQGTPAAEMASQVSGRIAMHRATKLGKLGKTLRAGYFRELVGRSLQVLVEGAMPGQPGWIGGTSEYHAPVALPGGPELFGQFVRVVGQRVENGRIWASPELGPELDDFTLIAGGVSGYITHAFCQTLPQATGGCKSHEDGSSSLRGAGAGHSHLRVLRRFP
jgi:threonylcarbamoyladenosine tRNA methylthiotransferase MtaB